MALSNTTLRRPALTLMLAACLAAGAAPGTRLSDHELKPAPAFDAEDGVPAREGWALGPTSAATLRSIAEILPTRRIAPAPRASVLREPTAPYAVTYSFGGHEHTIADFAARTDTTGLLILKGDQIVFEGYYQGADRQDTFMSFSTGKSFVSTLVALAVGDGSIKSIEDPVVRYLPEVAGSAYEKAKIRDVLQMSSGTSYTEEYEDPKSDIAQFARLMDRNQGGLYDFSRSFKAARPPGTQFYYASTDTEVMGALVARATGKSLSQYMSERLWKPLGAEAPARWALDQPGAAGREMAAGGLQVELRDYGRFGLLFANDGRVGERQLLPKGWVAEATRPRAPYVDFGKLVPGYPLGYGYFWWCLPGPNNRFTAEGIHGQFVFVDPVEKLVVVKLSSWPHAWEDEKELETYAFIDAVSAATRGSR
jgi:CubicO group peptidase (beta-lactamase class C family)